MQLKGKVVIITGAGQGAGREYALCFSQEGASVVVADWNALAGQQVAEEVKQGGGSGIFVETDVSSQQSCRNLLDVVRSEYGRVDALLNNAAVFRRPQRPFWEVDVEEWDLFMAVNVRGIWLATSAVVPIMQEQRSGRIINISSSAIWTGIANIHYITSKGAVVAMTRTMARELGDWGITVNAVTPGALSTGAAEPPLIRERKQNVVQRQAIKRLGTPADIVGMLLFLCSDEAGYITGQTFNLDGGESMR